MDVYVTRTQAKSLPCPYCDVEKFQKCMGKRGERQAVHRERIQAYVDIYVRPMAEQ